MGKPTIFFSHSSKDKRILTLLKEMLLVKTGNTIDIFLSSDGQSLPFGKNWVHSIEEGLSNASIMFVFLSPAAIQAGWVYFESGYCYARDIEVIPVGILGIDLNEVKPPLSLLQGFNIVSAEGLNNIISIVNRKFDFSHKKSFSIEDYQRLMNACNYTEMSCSRVYELIHHIKIEMGPSIQDKEQKLMLQDGVLDAISELLKGKERNFGAYKNYGKYGKSIHTHGLTIMEIEQPAGKLISIYLDPLVFKNNIDIIKHALNVGFPRMDHYWLDVYFNLGVGIVVENFRVSSRLYGSLASISKEQGDLLEYKGLRFNFNSLLDDQQTRKYPEEISLNIIYNIEDFNADIIIELIEVLHNHSVLYSDKQL